ncbi:hypothetical protein B2A_15076, partial [mine drainage metagenome]
MWKIAKKELNGYNTHSRTIRTLSGPLDLRIHVRVCKDHKESNRTAINSLLGGSDFDPRVIISIGIMRWLMDYQVSEIQILMESRGIRISTGEISNLSVEFLLRFYCIHIRHMKDLKLKEYILHLDGTGESGDEIVFMAKDGSKGITLDARIMPSESR